MFIRVETKPVVSDGASVLVPQVKPQIAGVALLMVVKCVLWDQYSANTQQQRVHFQQIWRQMFGFRNINCLPDEFSCSDSQFLKPLLDDGRTVDYRIHWDWGQEVNIMRADCRLHQCVRWLGRHDRGGVVFIRLIPRPLFHFLHILKSGCFEKLCGFDISAQKRSFNVPSFRQ